MTALSSCVSGGGDYRNSLTDCLLGSLVHNAPRTGNILVSTQRNIEYADVVTFTIRDYPMNTGSDVFFSYATALTYLHEHEIRFVRQAVIHAINELSITSSDDRRL